ncbi:hypothetical protein [Nonlabens ponticola]|uniref:Alpha/beta hydrolase n=1 Tax=Nonlabens ponticola TaxID=2496866 RepID=A0A3S9MUS9_9FLAO|nr:hypothetical protein [Nonlabens ponticola]AZQ42936.1 hypothetical protein EJ995_01305 [Nonlabens ponticola]
MNRILIFLVIGITFASCKQGNEEKAGQTTRETEFKKVVRDDYQLYKPASEIKAVLILFGGYPEDAEGIKREFPILEDARNNSIAVIMSNYNQKLWLEENEKRQLATSLQDIFEEHHLPSENVVVGGYSSGGVVSLLISDFIIGHKQFYIDPKGVFIVDSPIDLEVLYRTAEKNIERDFSEPSIQESTWLLKELGSGLGNPDEHIENYEQSSIYTYSTGNISNLKKLKKTKIRLYTEPDTLWWQENRMASYDETNAFYIQDLHRILTQQGYNKVEYIPTVDKGYRANGMRHPHSWSIVDKADLIDWILN